VIELRDVSLTSAGRTLCQGLNWQLPDPGAYLLLGPNGSGKSLLCQLATGRLRPSAGQVLLDGRQVYGRLGVRCDCWYSQAETALRDDEPVEGYLEQELATAGGSVSALATVWPLLDLKLGGRQQRLSQLAHGQALLAEIALAACVPQRLVVLDGHLSYLDPSYSQAAAQLLQASVFKDERFVLLTASRLADSGLPLRQVFALDGGLPVDPAPLAWEPAGAPVTPALDRRLVIYPAGVPGPAWQLVSGRSFAVTGATEGGGWQVKLRGSLEQLLAELQEQGVALQRLEWNPPPAGPPFD
jgi:ABC-type cobalamin/Fe3+-siderophores transport system ATPase subunit